MMKDEKLHRFTAKIADVEAISFPIKLEEEEIYRKAAYHVNKLWQSNLSAQPGKSSHFALAKVALAFAELYYRKAQQLSAQSKVLESFEKELDEILLTME